MKLTLSIFKADIGSPGGHTRPSQSVLDAVQETFAAAQARGLLIDMLVTHTGDDIAITCSHTAGPDNTELHQLAWQAFLNGTAAAQVRGDYGAGQDLLADAPSGNIRGAGPAVARTGVRPQSGQGQQGPPSRNGALLLRG